MLAAYQNISTFIEEIELTSIGIELLVISILSQVRNKFRQSTYNYKMVLDFEYPFNRPFVFFLKKDSSYAQCKDLLDILLEGNNWGPSLMLSYFLDRIQSISVMIGLNLGNHPIKRSLLKQNALSFELKLPESFFTINGNPLI